MPLDSSDGSVEDERRAPEWDLRFGFRNYRALIVSQLLSSVLAFGSVWLLTRYLGADGYGKVVALLAAAQLAAQLGVNWTMTAVARFGCQEFVESGSLAKSFWTRLAILVPNALLVVLTGDLWMPPVARWLRLPDPLLPLIALLFLANVGWLHVQQALQAAKLPRLQGVLLALERLQIVLVVLALVVAERISAESVARAFVIAPSVASVIGLWRLRSLIAPAFSFDRRLLGSIVTFSLPLIPYSIVGYFSTSYLDAFFVSRFLSTETLGVYAVAVQVSGTLMQPTVLAGSLLMPLFVTLQVTGREALVSRLFREVLPLGVLAWSLVCVVAGLAGTILLPAVFGAAFRESARALWPLLAASAVASPSLLGYAPLASARSLTGIGALAGLGAAAVNLGLNYLLIPRFGLVGCAWATCGAYAVSTVLAAGLLQRRIPGVRTSAYAASLPAVAAACVHLRWESALLTALATLSLTVPLLVLNRQKIRSTMTALASLASR